MTYKNKTGKSNQYNATLIVLTPLSKSELAILSAIGRRPWDKFKAGCGTKQDWFEMATQLRVGYEATRQLYETISFLEYRESYKAAIAIKDRAVASPNQSDWSMTEEEGHLIDMGLTAIDLIRTQVNRRTLAIITRDAVEYMRKQYLPDGSYKPLPPPAYKV